MDAVAARNAARRAATRKEKEFRAALRALTSWAESAPDCVFAYIDEARYGGFEGRLRLRAELAALADSVPSVNRVPSSLLHDATLVRFAVAPTLL
jgi:hypothetical protein